MIGAAARPSISPAVCSRSPPTASTSTATRSPTTATSPSTLPPATRRCSAYDYYAGGTAGNTGGTLTNNGTITEQNAGGLDIFDSITLNNALGGVFQLTGTGGLVYGNFASSVTNAGTFIIAMTAATDTPVGAGLIFTNTSTGIVELTSNVTATINGRVQQPGRHDNRHGWRPGSCRRYQRRLCHSDRPGTTTFTAANTYTGATTISSGTLLVGASTALGSGAVILNDSNTGSNNTALLLNPGVTLANSITVTNNGSSRHHDRLDRRQLCRGKPPSAI